MKYYTKDLVSKYYKEIKQKYPNLTEEELKRIVSAPFTMVREDMENLELSTCRLKYLGTFTVYEGRAKHSLKNLDKAFSNGNITEEEYNRLKKNLDDYLGTFD